MLVALLVEDTNKDPSREQYSAFFPFTRIKRFNGHQNPTLKQTRFGSFTNTTFYRCWYQKIAEQTVVLLYTKEEKKSTEINFIL